MLRKKLRERRPLIDAITMLCTLLHDVIDEAEDWWAAEQKLDETFGVIREKARG